LSYTRAGGALAHRPTREKMGIGAVPAIE